MIRPTLTKHGFVPGRRCDAIHIGTAYQISDQGSKLDVVSTYPSTSFELQCVFLRSDIVKQAEDENEIETKSSTEYVVICYLPIFLSSALKIMVTAGTIVVVIAFPIVILATIIF